MHSVTMHEILFSFTFVWPSAVVLSLLVLRAGEKPPRPLFWFAILAGPVATLTLLTAFLARVWNLDADGYVPGATEYHFDHVQRRLDGWLLAVLGVASIAGGASLLLRGGPAHLWALRVHAVLAAIVWFLFLVYAYRHLRALSSRGLAALTVLGSAAMVSTTYPARIVFMATSAAVILSYRWAARNWRIARHPYRETEQRGKTDALQVGLLWVLAVGTGVLLATGIAIFVHPGWTRFYLYLIQAHSHLGYALWAAFFVFLYRHVRQYADRRAALEAMALCGLITSTMLTLNYIFSWKPLLNIPIFVLIFWLSGRLSRRLAPTSGTLMYRAGMGLTFVALLTFSSGAYIAEPFNSWLNNNMGLYVVYAHGTGVLVLVPWLIGMTVHHVWPRLAERRRLAVARTLALGLLPFVVLFLAGSVYAYWKWFGLDAGIHYWPPELVGRLFEKAKRSRVTYRTYSGPPPITAEGSYPPEFDASFRDATVCSTEGCHGGLVKTWKASTHRFAASNTFFRKVMERMQEDLGTDEVNYFCINCHDPALVLHPDRAKGIDLDRLAESDGISCKTCHLMCTRERNDRPGAGRYEIRPEVEYPVKITDPGYGKRWPAFIRWDLRLHFRNYSIPHLAHTGEMCAACHVASMPVFLTGFDEDMVVTDLYTSWQKSDYARRGQTCVKCHMPPRRPKDERGFFYPDHRIPGLNVGITLMVDGDEERRKDAAVLEEFTRDLLAHPEEAWPDSVPFLDMAIQVPERARSGQIVPMVVRTTNSRVGHYFHAGPSSLNEVWLEVKVTDTAGRVLFHSGSLGERDRAVDPAAHRLGATLRDREGRVIRDCAIWRVSSVEGARRIQPFETVEDRFDVPLPADARGPLTVEAGWNHRRASQEFVDWVYGGKGPEFPVVRVAGATAQLAVEP